LAQGVRNRLPVTRMNAFFWATLSSVALATTTTREEALASPVAKVVKLLTDMQTDLKAEQKNDEKNYDTMMCWCKTNEKEKTKSIDDADTAITSLTAEIESRTARQEALTKDIADHEAAAKKAQESLDAAYAQRQKEGKANQGTILDLTKNIQALTGAIVVLKKHQATEFPQIKVEFLQAQAFVADTPEDKFNKWMDANHYERLSASAQQEVEHYEQQHLAKQAKERLYDGYTFSEMQTLTKAKKAMKAFAQYTPDYAPQSGEIYGILTTMKEQMEEDLKELEEKEGTAVTDYNAMEDDLKATLATEEDNAKRKTAEKVDNGRALSAAKTSLEDNEATLEADTAYLKNVKETCETAEKDWGLRKKTRAEELLAISEAIGILTEDDAVDVAKSALGNDAFLQKTSFLQMRTLHKRASVRTLAAKALQKVAAKTHSHGLMQLSAAVQLDGFEKVKKAIKEMEADLKQEQADEVKHKDFCNTEFHENDMLNTTKAQDKKELEALLGVLGDKNDTLTADKATAMDELAQLKVDIQQANIDRVEANQAFQSTIEDQTATKNIVLKAYDRLQQFYAEKAFVQKRVMLKKSAQQPPVEVGEYKKHGGSSSVLVMLENLVHECDELKAEALKSEQEAQAGYEKFISESNALMGAKMESIVNLGKELAATEQKKIAADDDLAGVISDMEDIAKTVGDLHGACDFVLKNFDVRQKARGDEIEALQQAYAILSGA